MPRGPAHVKVRTSAKNHWKTADIWADPALRSAWVGLLDLAVERWAQRTGDTFLCSTTDLQRATGCRSNGAALKRMDKLVRVAREAVERHARDTGGLQTREPAVTYTLHGSGWRVALCNFAKNQGMITRIALETGPTATATATATKRTKRKSPRAAPSVVAMELAQELLAYVKAVHPTARVPAQLVQWGRAADQMLERDKRTPEQVRAAIAWLGSENARAADAGEPAFVVQSMATLRRKFDAMAEQARRSHARRQRGVAGAAADVRRIL